MQPLDVCIFFTFKILETNGFNGITRVFYTVCLLLSITAFLWHDNRPLSKTVITFIKEADVLT
jgi:hypothetical protein